MRTPRGFTLVELLISLVIVSIVLTAVAAVFIGVQGSYDAISRSKGAIESSRSAVTFLDRSVRLAGYGLDPRYAIDFTVGGSHVKDNEAVGTLGSVVVVTDDLAYRYRDPNWVRRGGLSDTTATATLTIDGTMGVPFRAGQRFLIACGGGRNWTVYQLNAAATAATASAAVTRVAAPFPVSTEACLKNTTGTQAAYVMLLQERRVRLRDVGGRPFLVSYRVISDTAGAMSQPSTLTDYDPVAADIEEFQVSYVMNRPPDMAAGATAYRSACCASTAAPDASPGNANWVLLDTPSETGSAFLPTASATEPALDTPYDDAKRYNLHPANIRQVRINLVARSQRQDANKTRWSTALSLENSSRTSPAPTPDGFFRVPSTHTIPVTNLQSRSTFTPDLRTTAGEGNFNGG